MKLTQAMQDQLDSRFRRKYEPPDFVDHANLDDLVDLDRFFERCAFRTLRGYLGIELPTIVLQRRKETLFRVFQDLLLTQLAELADLTDKKNLA